MTTGRTETPEMTGENMQRLSENLARVEALSKRLIGVLSNKKAYNAALNSPDPELFTKAITKYWSGALENPSKLLEHQLGFWAQSVTQFMQVQHSLTEGKEQPDDSAPKDRRFANPLWDSNPYFTLIKRQYQLCAQTLEQAVADVEGMDDLEKRRLTHFSKQIIDMMAPTNFLATNPDALEKAVATEGQSLIDGLENLVADLEANDGELVVRLADESAFELGVNIATTPGEVVFRNRMFELIQYTPVTETVHTTPLIIFPPWINKFYVLDLKEQNSMIKWITEQGYTLFVVSWVNPDTSYRDVGVEEYIEDGFLTAINVAKEITGEKQVNCVGYCIAGTTLCMTLSLLKQRGDKSIKSATLFTALTDFSEQGEFTPFLQNDFIDGIEAEVADKGILPSYLLARTFSYLRANDLIYTPAIRNYMMGESPPAFDLLYWNGDGSNLPAKMAIQYLRSLCQGNAFADGGFDLLGTTLHLSEVEVPLCAIACESDHIAAWKDCFRGVQQMGAKDKTFIMTQSGHIAGIVNPPSRNKYGHYSNADMTLDADAWQAGSTFHEGSWWPRWENWLTKRSGKQVAARVPGDSGYPALTPAPGTYVSVKAND